MHMEKPFDHLPKELDFGGNTTKQRCQELSLLLKQRTHLYREENARLEAILSDVKVLNEDIKLTSETLQMKNYIRNDSSLTDLERLRKQNNYISKLKTCIKFYTNLNGTLFKILNLAKSELDQATSKVHEMLSINLSEIQQLQGKARRYESDLLKFEKKHLWLKDTDFNLPTISKEIEVLKGLKEKRDRLIKDLSTFENLKPDLKEASQQLADIKEEHKQFMQNKMT